MKLNSAATSALGIAICMSNLPATQLTAAAAVHANTEDLYFELDEFLEEECELSEQEAAILRDMVKTGSGRPTVELKMLPMRKR